MVAQLVKTLRHKAKDRAFDSLSCSAGCTMVLGSTQSLTEGRVPGIYPGRGGLKAAGAYG